MKKTIFIGLLLSIVSVFSVLSETYPVTLKTYRNGGNIGNGSIGRAPMSLPIEVTYDDVTGVVTASAPEDLEGEVYIYNVNGALEGSSQTLNATFTLTTPGLHVITLQGESWIGEAKIIL